MEYLIAILVVILGAVLLFLKKTFSYWDDLGVRQFPLDFPQGNIKGIGKDYHMSQFLVKYYKKCKEAGERFCGVYFFTRPILMITDLELVKTILVKDFNVFPNRGFYHNEKVKNSFNVYFSYQ
jgi:cytochrome P450 family 6